MGELLAGVALLAQEALEVVVVAAQMVAPLLAEDDLVEADAVALGIDVQLAHGVGLVAVVAEDLRHGRQVRISYGRCSLKTRSPWVRAVVPVISARRAGMQVGVAV